MGLVKIDLPDDYQQDYFNLPEFNAPVWTDPKLRAFLDSHGIKYQVGEKSKYDGGIQYNLSVCPKCRQSEGNPAMWRQDGVPHFKCFRAKTGCDQFTFADLQAYLHRPTLNRVNAGELVEKYLRPRSVVVRRLIRHGDVVNVIGGPKARKSFLVMQLALCIASGTPFLGWETVQGRVLLIDNELRGDDLAYRLTAMAKAMGLRWDDVAGYIDIMPLRGKLADLTTIRDELCGLPPDTYSLVILDALYKALPAGVDENSNSNITQNVRAPGRDRREAQLHYDGGSPYKQGQPAREVRVRHGKRGGHARMVQPMSISCCGSTRIRTRWSSRRLCDLSSRSKPSA